MITHTQPAPQTAPTPPRTNRERRKPHNHTLRRLVLSANAIALNYEALCRDAGVPVRTDLIDTLNFAVDDLRQDEADRAADAKRTQMMRLTEAMRTGGGNSQ